MVCNLDRWNALRLEKESFQESKQEADGNRNRSRRQQTSSERKSEQRTNNRPIGLPSRHNKNRSTNLTKAASLSKDTWTVCFADPYRLRRGRATCVVRLHAAMTGQMGPATLDYVLSSQYLKRRNAASSNEQNPQPMPRAGNPHLQILEDPVPLQKPRPQPSKGTEYRSRLRT